MKPPAIAALIVAIALTGSQAFSSGTTSEAEQTENPDAPDRLSIHPTAASDPE